MTPRLFYLFFFRVTQLVRLSGRDRGQLAVEVVVLCHDVSVLGRQPPTPHGSRPARGLLGGLARLLPASASDARWYSPTPCSAGTEKSSAAAGATCTGDADGLRSLPAPSRWRATGEGADHDSRPSNARTSRPPASRGECGVRSEPDRDRSAAFRTAEQR